jgi:hypothetical protein
MLCFGCCHVLVMCTSATVGIKVRIKGKPIRDGIKVFAICCPVTGYCLHFVVQEWTSFDKKHPRFGEFRRDWASIPALVSHLARKAAPPRRDGRKHVIIMDRYFTTVKSCVQLLEDGYHCVGTLNTMYGGVPKAVLWTKKKRTHGSMRFARSEDGRILLQQWEDRSTVQILSTMHQGFRGPPSLTGTIADMPKVSRRRRVAAAKWVTNQVPCPPAVRTYQEFMKGVDLNDQVCVFQMLSCLNSFMLLVPVAVFLFHLDEEQTVVYEHVLFPCGHVHRECFRNVPAQPASTL